MEGNQVGNGIQQPKELFMVCLMLRPEHQTARHRLGVVRMQNDNFFTLPMVRPECTSYGSEDIRKDR